MLFHSCKAFVLLSQNVPKLFYSLISKVILFNKKSQTICDKFVSIFDYAYLMNVFVILLSNNYFTMIL